MCGEHRANNPDVIRRNGSSPRVRGTLATAGADRMQRRFIPACAGNTNDPAGICSALTVHPRVCGEHANLPLAVNCTGGSSPRVRGTHEMKITYYASNRFIPACAGNTVTATSRSKTSAVHPRVCGEHLKLDLCDSCNTGSSPRVRGTPGRRRNTQTVERFIPACAGNTLPLSHGFKTKNQ